MKDRRIDKLKDRHRQSRRYTDTDKHKENTSRQTYIHTGRHSGIHTQTGGTNKIHTQRQAGNQACRYKQRDRQTEADKQYSPAIRYALKHNSADRQTPSPGKWNIKVSEEQKLHRRIHSCIKNQKKVDTMVQTFLYPRCFRGGVARRKERVGR